MTRGQSAQPAQSAPEPATKSKKGSTKVRPETSEPKVVPDNPHKRIAHWIGECVAKLLAESARVLTETPTKSPRIRKRAEV